jgi:hypothetical protein
MSAYQRSLAAKNLLRPFVSSWLIPSDSRSVDAVRNRLTPPTAQGPPKIPAMASNGAPAAGAPVRAAAVGRAPDDFSEAELAAALRRKAAQRPPLLKRLAASVAAAWSALLRGAAPLDHPEQAPPMERFLSAMPAWLVSVIVHTSIILLLCLIAVEVHRQETSEMAVELSAIDEDFKDDTFAETLGQQLENPGPSQNELDLPPEAFDSSYAISDLPEVDDPLAAPKPSLEMSAEGWDLFSDVDAPSIGMALTGREKGRKEALLASYGGTRTTQQSVALALAWIARKQSSDGSWSLQGPYPDGSGTENRLSATAMAMIAFQGDGHTHQAEGPYRRHVQKGVKYLLKAQGKEGEFTASGMPMHHSLYTQAQCTIAICELYGMTQDSHLRDYAQKSIDYCVKIQAPEGGWRYFPFEDSDTSVTGWFVMALQSARMAGLEAPTPCLSKVSKFLDTVASHNGSRYAYQPGRVDTPVMTAEALLCRQYLGWQHNDKRLLAGVRHIGRHPVDWSEQNVYYWYYATQVMHHMGGKPWIEWNNVMRQVVPENQEAKGRERGSWDPSDDDWGRSAGRLYMTCLSTYMLEVYYRHLPLYSIKLNSDPETEHDEPAPDPDAVETAQSD